MASSKQACLVRTRGDFRAVRWASTHSGKVNVARGAGFLVLGMEGTNQSLQKDSTKIFYLVKVNCKSPSRPALKAPAKKDNSDIGKFIALVQQGIDAWNEAGKRLVIMMEKDPGILKTIQIMHPDISYDMLATFERIGRKQIYAPLLAQNSAAAHRLLEMPFEEQQKYCKGKIAIAVKQRDGTFITNHKRLAELTSTEINMVFGFDGVRTIERQIKMHKEREKSYPMTSIVAPVKPPASLGFFKITADETGKLLIAPSKDNGRAHYTKALLGSGSTWETVIQVFKPAQ